MTIIWRHHNVSITREGQFKGAGYDVKPLNKNTLITVLYSIMRAVDITDLHHVQMLIFLQHSSSKCVTTEFIQFLECSLLMTVRSISTMLRLNFVWNSKIFFQVNTFENVHQCNFNVFIKYDIDGLVQERRNASALAMKLRISCTNP